jgi:hypothetical protein
VQKPNRIKVNDISLNNFVQWTEFRFINILCKKIFFVEKLRYISMRLFLIGIEYISPLIYRIDILI